jgi:hypothetical protein
LLSRLHRFRWLAVALGVVPTALVVLAVVGATAGGTHSSAPAASPHELTGPPAWPRSVEGLRNRRRQSQPRTGEPPGAGAATSLGAFFLVTNVLPATVPAAVALGLEEPARMAGSAR